MRTFKLKKWAKEIRNMQDKLEFLDDTITTSGVHNNNPLNDVDAKTEISSNCNIHYTDINGKTYPKKLIDLYYEEV